MTLQGSLMMSGELTKAADMTVVTAGEAVGPVGVADICFL